MLRYVSLNFILKTWTQEVALLISGFRVTQARVQQKRNGNPDPCCQLSNFISRPGHFPGLETEIVKSNS